VLASGADISLTKLGQKNRIQRNFMAIGKLESDLAIRFLALSFGVEASPES
jgi:hypothetical protein